MMGIIKAKTVGSDPLICRSNGRRGAGIILAIFSILFLLGTWAAQRAQAQVTYTVLHSFQGGSSDGGNANAPVIVGNDGNLYGTTISGGGSGYGGTVYKVDTFGNESLVYKFPVYPVYHSNNGYNCYVFSAPDGGRPYAPLVMGADGNLYGTAAVGGANGYQCFGPGLGTNGDGAVFKLNLSSTPLSVSAPYSFTSPVDDYGSPGLAVGPEGNLYGINTVGNSSTFGVFKLDASGSPTQLYTFPSGSVGYFSPLSKLMLDSSGNIYGTSTGGSAYSNGIVYELVNSSGTYNTEKVLHAFAGGADGANPSGGLIMDGNGNLYGLTSGGGGSSACNNAYGCGTVFELVNSSGSYTEKILYSFTGGSDGGDPTGELVMDAAGNLYGTAFSGGDTSLNNGSGAGVVFEIDPSGNETVLHAFGSFTGDGVESGEGYGGLAMDAVGNLYGTTNGYSGSGYGTVFKLTTPQLGTLAALNQVNALSSQGALNSGQANSLAKELQRAVSMINAGNSSGAIGILEGFIAEVTGLENSGALSSAQASSLINAANAAIAQLI